VQQVCVCVCGATEMQSESFWELLPKIYHPLNFSPSSRIKGFVRFCIFTCLFLYPMTSYFPPAMIVLGFKHHSILAKGQAPVNN
jgi:hypothetical protein